jgi:hypothetical protein
MFKRGKSVARCSTSWISGEFSRRLRCRIICIFSQRLLTGMHPSAISRNGLSAGSTKHIALRIVGRLCQTAPQRLGDGKKAVSIACCDLMNPCRTKWEYLRQKSGPRRFCRTSGRLAIPVSIQCLVNWRLTQTPYNPDLEHTRSCSYRRGRFR